MLDQWPEELREELATILGYSENGSISETGQCSKTGDRQWKTTMRSKSTGSNGYKDLEFEHYH